MNVFNNFKKLDDLYKISKEISASLCKIILKDSIKTYY
jgi:hypothetical protein